MNNIKLNNIKRMKYYVKNEIENNIKNEGFNKLLDELKLVNKNCEIILNLE